MELTVIYDPVTQIAATVDTDNLIAYGPLAPGELGAEALNDWLEAEPYDWGAASPELLRSLFHQWLARTGHPLATGAQPSPAPPEAPPATAPASDAALAEHEAQNGGDSPPPPQPADSDPTATAGPTPAEPSPGAATPEPTPEPAPAPVTTTASCPNCQGQGAITHQGENGPVTNTCGMCQGSGTVTVTA